MSSIKKIFFYILENVLVFSFKTTLKLLLWKKTWWSCSQCDMRWFNKNILCLFKDSHMVNVTSYFILVT